MEGNYCGIIEKTVLKKTYEEAYIEWRIPDFFKLIPEREHTACDSPPFIIDGVSWYMCLYPKVESHDEFISLYIITEHLEEREYHLIYNLGLKKLDGSIEEKIIGILVGDDMSSESYDYDFIEYSELLRRKSVLVPRDVLTITCRLKREIAHSTQSSDKAIPMKLIKLDKLSDNFKNLFENKETCDVTLRVKDKEYKAHKSVLIARSSVFAVTFMHDTLERQTGVITIPDCDPDSFQKFLEYLYCGKLEEISPHSAQNLYYTSDKYDFEELKAFCVEYLMQCLTVENICEVVVLADKYEETALLSAVQEFFNKNLYKILVTPEWESFMKNDHRLANKLMIEMAKVKHKD